MANYTLYSFLLLPLLPLFLLISVSVIMKYKQQYHLKNLSRLIIVVSEGQVPCYFLVHWFLNLNMLIKQSAGLTSRVSGQSVWAGA